MFIYYLDVLNWSLCLRKPVLVFFCKPGYFQCWFLWDINLNFIQALSLPVVNSVKSKPSADMGWCTWLINLQPWTSWYLTVGTWLSRISYSYHKWQKFCCWMYHLFVLYNEFQIWWLGKSYNEWTRKKENLLSQVLIGWFKHWYIYFHDTDSLNWKITFSFSQKITFSNVDEIFFMFWLLPLVRESNNLLTCICNWFLNVISFIFLCNMLYFLP